MPAKKSPKKTSPKKESPRASPKSSPKKAIAKKTKRNRKDPNTPKRPLSAYFFFMADFRKSADAKASKEAGGVQQVARDGGKKWKAMAESSKKKYEDMATKDKARYIKEMNDAGLKTSATMSPHKK